MKKNVIIGLVLVIVAISAIFLLVSGLNGNNLNINANAARDPVSTLSSERSGMVGISHEIQLNTSLPDFPEKLMVYKTLKPDTSRDAIIAFAKKFGLTGEINEGDTAISIGTDDEGATISKISGSKEFSNQTRLTTDDGIDMPDNLPSDDQAIKIATTFLQDRDLYPTGMILGGAHHQKSISVDDQGRDSTHFEMIYVWFDRTLNGLDVEGSQTEVGIGGHGDVINYFANWRNYEPYKKLALKSPEQALIELKGQGVGSGMREPGNVVIEKVYLAYYTKVALETENYLEPVYVFKGHSDGGKVDEMIPALKEVPAELGVLKS
ncbi:MAG: hypothetical protein LUQ66_04045 [Methanoregula sp.]|nr:hypothetical protein [Methanoregula sp.]